MLLLLAIATGLVALYLLAQTVRPLVEGGVVTAEEWQRVEDESLALLQRRDQLLAELRDIEFEAALNKIDARDLEAMRRRYELEAIELDKQLDEQVGQYDDRIEAQVEETLAAAQARRDAKAGGASAPDEAPAAAAPAAAPPAGDAPVELAKAPAAAPAPEPAPAATQAPGADCRACGTALDPDAAFCDGCGAPVATDHACAACGTENRPGARFCKGCGASLAEEAAS